VLDANGTEVAAGRDYLLGTGKWEYLQTGVRIEQDGTIEVMAGTSGIGEAVYFDNLRVEQTGGLIVQEQHQYAFGAPLPGMSYVVGNKRYRYGYQGQYAEQDDETDFNSFELRLYNSRVGRWMSYDPEGQFDSPYIGMGNNPISEIDPDGGWSGPKPKFRPSGYGLHAAKGLSSTVKSALRGTSSAMRALSSVRRDATDKIYKDTRQVPQKAYVFVPDVIGPPPPPFQNDFEKGVQDGDDIGHLFIGVRGIIKSGLGLYKVTVAAAPVLYAVLKSAKHREFWKLTEEAAVAIKYHRKFKTFYKSSNGLWWSVDKAGHGGSKFKVFKETKTGLEWIHDADEYGDYIKGKHKGPTGEFIPWKDFD
jgi:RHS repeat-associated protein